MMATKFVCSQPGCSSSFKSKSKLVRHNVTHSTLKLHTCQECKKCFKRKDHLSRHMLTHKPDEKTYICPYESCLSTRFVDNYHLKRHIVCVHESSNCCFDCKLTFKKKWENLEHQHYKHGSKAPFRCRHCFQPFFTDSHYYPHLDECKSKEVKILHPTPIVYIPRTFPYYYPGNRMQFLPLQIPMLSFPPQQ
eukprot:TRINITY_DN1051_c0_g1_i3.p1 TRINITY_DN1051_c0_g1~~TRINITY_DN1051_c0_g1_i3.p1  ORF type:complete len:192 (+),score=8.20 TRINITY_DN1051_c0_g1_i3:75-650(+)